MFAALSIYTFFEGDFLYYPWVITEQLELQTSNPRVGIQLTMFEDVKP